MIIFSLINFFLQLSILIIVKFGYSFSKILVSEPEEYVHEIKVIFILLQIFLSISPIGKFSSYGSTNSFRFANSFDSKNSSSNSSTGNKVSFGTQKLFESGTK